MKRKTRTSDPRENAFPSGAKTFRTTGITAHLPNPGTDQAGQTNSDFIQLAFPIQQDVATRGSPEITSASTQSEFISTDSGIQVGKPVAQLIDHFSQTMKDFVSSTPIPSPPTELTLDERQRNALSALAV